MFKFAAILLLTSLLTELTNATVITYNAEVTYHDFNDSSPGGAIYGNIGFTLDPAQPETRDWYVEIFGQLYEQTGNASLNGVGSIRDTESVSWLIGGTVEFDPFDLNVLELWAYDLDPNASIYDALAFTPYTMMTLFTLDDVRYTSNLDRYSRTIHNVPEPATIGLLCAGLALIGLRRRIK